MKAIVSVILCFLVSWPGLSQGLAGKWLVYEDNEGLEMTVSLTPKCGGKATLSLIGRAQAVSYGEGSQFWGTFRATGGYYFIVKGVSTESIRWKETDSTLVITRLSKPVVTVSASLDEDYSTRGISDEGGYKKQIIAQWKRDFKNNADVQKHKQMMQEALTSYYDDAFEVLLEGKRRIIERTEDTIVLENLSLDNPRMKWQRIK